MNLSNIDVLLLAGGQGTRIRDHLLLGMPKCLADINETPFLEIILHQFCDIGFFRFVLCLGYNAESVRKKFMLEYGEEALIRRRGTDGRFRDYYIHVSEEKQPLGTGGAIVNALPAIHSDPFIIANGDTICDIDFNALLENHQRVGFPVTVPIDDQYRNVGVYVFTKSAMHDAALNLGPKFDLDDAIGNFSKTGVLVNWYSTAAVFYDIGSFEELERFRCMRRETAPTV